MKNILNFVYCFDQNYNKQAVTSINSLVTKLENPNNLFIIHNNISSFDKSAINNKACWDIHFYEFKNSNLAFLISKMVMCLKQLTLEFLLKST